MRRLQLVLRTHHSLALLLPFNYCILSYSLVFCSALFTHFSSLSRFVFTCLSLSLSPLLRNLSVFSSDKTFLGGLQMWESLDQLAAAVRTHTHKDTVICGICGAMCTPCMLVGASGRVRKIKDAARVLHVRRCARVLVCVCVGVACWLWTVGPSEAPLVYV